MWLRADTDVRTNETGEVLSWGSRVNPAQRAIPFGDAPILLTNIAGESAVTLGGSTFMEFPSVMPVNKDYTLVVVAQFDNLGATNNVVSGNSRAFYLGSSPNPRVLHSGNFSQQAVSSIGVSGASVLRVRFNNTSGMARVAINNKQGAQDPVPANVDSVIFLGAFQRGNFMIGRISEVLIYDRELEGEDLATLDSYLHARYSIARVPDPAPPKVVFTELPANLLVAKCNSTLRVSGVVTSAQIRTLSIGVDTAGTSIASIAYTYINAGDTFDLPFTVESGKHLYNVVVTIDTGGTTFDTIVNNRDITCGEVIAINGQSNSIFGGTGLPPSKWTRTFGGNASQQSADTTYKLSSIDGSGGGANVGAFGLYLQNAIAEKMGTPSLVINGGVGGTRIEQHLPDPANRLNLSTIYGSWLYRIIKSGSRERIRWLFWYQGESNGGNDDYLTLFDQLRTAWVEDLPNLAHIVVIQIRPGCGPSGHHKIRDAQRKIESRYPDIISHAASGLPFHDGCHYTSEGYFTLGEQLYDIYMINELSLRPSKYATSAAVQSVHCLNQPCTSVRANFIYADDLKMSADTMVGGLLRTARDAFFSNGDPLQKPDSVTVLNNHVDLIFSGAVTTLSYVPDKLYEGTDIIYQGPWLVNSRGVGALTFYNVEISPTSVSEETDNTIIKNEQIIIHRGGELNSPLPQLCTVISIQGNVVATHAEAIPMLSVGVYFIQTATGTKQILIIP